MSILMVCATTIIINLVLGFILKESRLRATLDRSSMHERHACEWRRRADELEALAKRWEEIAMRNGEAADSFRSSLEVAMDLMAAENK